MKKYVIWVFGPDQDSGIATPRTLIADHFAISNNGDLMLFGPPTLQSNDPMEPKNTNTLFAAYGAGCWDSIEELRE